MLLLDECGMGILLFSLLKENATFKFILNPFKCSIGAHSALPFVD